MSSYYVKSGAAGAADGSSWTDAFTTDAAALAVVAAGDTVYESHQHAESTAGNISITSASATPAGRIKIECVNDGAAPPTAGATTATVDVTGNSSITFTSYLEVSGTIFRTQASNNTGNINILTGTTAPGWVRLNDCSLLIRSTNTAPRLSTGPASGQVASHHLVEFNNVIVGFGEATQAMIVRTPLRWKGGSLSGTAPTTLFKSVATTTPGLVVVSGVDLSLMGSGCSLVDVASTACSRFLFLNCKLGASVVLTTGTNPGPGGTQVDLINCDSGDTITRFQRHRYQGDVYSETTIVRTSGGASDGVNPFSRKMVTTANSSFHLPLEGEPIPFWCESTSSQTATIEVVTDNVTLKDSEAWIEIEYLGTSGYPLSVFTSDRAASLVATGVNQTTSTTTWTTTGLTTPVKQKLSATFTPSKRGPYIARVMLAKASTTMYYDPKVSSSTGRQFLVGCVQ